MNISAPKTIAALCLVAGSAACGSDHHGKKTDGGGQNTPDAGTPDGDGASSATASPADPGAWITRGRWMMPIDAADAAALAATDVNQPISATIAPGVVFTVSNTGFKPPTPAGMASYGNLTITALSDNNLMVCGAGANAACTTATIRIYTTGAAGPGLWNAVAGYGAPILTSSHSIGLDVAGAYALGNAAIPATTHVVTLAKFVTGTTLPIPISVDFTNAGAGSYASTLVIEYAVQ